MTAIYEASKQLAELISTHASHAVASNLKVALAEDLRLKFFSYDETTAQQKALQLEQRIARSQPTTVSDLLALALVARSKVDNCEGADVDALTPEDIAILAGCLDGMISTLIQGMKQEEAPLLLSYGYKWILRQSQRDNPA